MKEIKKALLVCYIIQGIIPLVLFVETFLSRLGTSLLFLSVWQAPIILLTNAFACGAFFNRPYKKKLKEVHPKTYEKLYVDGLVVRDNFAFIDFAFGGGSDDEKCVNELKRYLRFFYFSMIINPINTFIFAVYTI